MNESLGSFHRSISILLCKRWMSDSLQTLSWDIPDENVVFVEKEDIDQYVGEHPVVLVHWFASVFFVSFL